MIGAEHNLGDLFLSLSARDVVRFMGGELWVANGGGRVEELVVSGTRWGISFMHPAGYVVGEWSGTWEGNRWGGEVKYGEISVEVGLGFDEKGLVQSGSVFSSSRRAGGCCLYVAPAKVYCHAEDIPKLGHVRPGRVMVLAPEVVLYTPGVKQMDRRGAKIVQVVGWA